MRPLPAEDTALAYQIFLSEIYRPPWPLDDVRSVVDLGANVGYATLYFARLFPGATIDAFEPHPAHLQQFRALVAANKLDSRVFLHAAAVGCVARRSFLSDAGVSSAIVNNGISVQVVDWFAFAANRRIDLLKVDIEGTEHELVADSRMESLRIPHIVIEWHHSPDVLERIRQIGYDVQAGPLEKNSNGMQFGLAWCSLRR